MTCGDCGQTTCGADCPGSGHVDDAAGAVRRLEGQILWLRDRVYALAAAGDLAGLREAGRHLREARAAMDAWRQAADPDLAILSLARELDALQFEAAS